MALNQTTIITAFTLAELEVWVNAINAGGGGGVSPGSFTTLAANAAVTFTGTSLTLSAAGVAYAVAGTSASGTDTAAGAITHTANLSTGNAAPGKIVFAVGAVGSTGAVVQTAANSLTVDDHLLTIGAAGLAHGVAGTAKSGADAAAGNLTVTANLSTGNAAPGTIIFAVGATGSTGSTVQTATTVMTIGDQIVSFAGSIAAGGAAQAQHRYRSTGNVTASGGAASNFRGAATLVAAANSDTLSGVSLAPVFTPGAFTGLFARGLSIGAFSVAAFTSPAGPIGVEVGVITGTGASVATGISIAPPTGATANYLIAHSTAATFNVTSAGLVTTSAGFTTTGGNVGIGGATPGTSFANGLFFGTTATTSPGSSVDLVHLGGLDISAGHRSLSITSEEVVNAAVATASTHRYPITLNGTQYALLLTTVLA